MSDVSWDEPTSAEPGTSEISLATNRARLITLAGPEAGRVFRISATTVIGRDQGAGVHVNAPEISRRHATILRDSGGDWLIEDHESRNGTLVNGVPIKGRHALRFGDRVQLGASAFFVFTLYDDLEEQVLQSQKMESVGRLAGGVAHDFTNLLAVIFSTVEQLRECTEDRDALPVTELNESLDVMSEAVDRALELTKRLLAFSRRSGEEHLPIDLSAFIDQVAVLARRAFPAKIAFETHVSPGLRIKGDSSQLHQVLMNLFINARDALAEGGNLLVRAYERSVDQLAALSAPLPSPGSYVVITVADSGSGMTEEACRRAFEPFFTTKGPDKGTGLGLATVYGVVKNHGGHVQLSSKLGEGTVARVYLPALDSEA